MKDLVKKVKDFLEERNWLTQPPGDIAKSIVIESAELLEHFQWTSFFSEDPTLDPEEKEEIKEELADVLIYAIEMSLVLGCDIEEIVEKKLAKAARKYPANSTTVLGSKKYKQIKKVHRAKIAKKGTK